MSKWAYNLLQFFVSCWENFLKLITFISQSYWCIVKFIIFLKTNVLPEKSQQLLFQKAWLEMFSSQISSVNKFVLCGLLTYFLHAAISQVFHGPGYSESRFFWVQFSRVQIQGIDLGLRFSFLLHSPGTGLKNRRLLH